MDEEQRDDWKRKVQTIDKSLHRLRVETEQQKSKKQSKPAKQQEKQSRRALNTAPTLS